MNELMIEAISETMDDAISENAMMDDTMEMMNDTLSENTMSENKMMSDIMETMSDTMIDTMIEDDYAEHIAVMLNEHDLIMDEDMDDMIAFIRAC